MQKSAIDPQRLIAQPSLPGGRRLAKPSIKAGT